MTENNRAQVNKCSDNQRKGDGHTPPHSRRQLLHTLAGGGALILAGCSDNLSSDPIGTPSEQSTSTAESSVSNLAQVNGQTFRTPIRQDPQKTSVYRGDDAIQDTAFARVVKEPASYSLRRFLRPPGLWINGRVFGPRPDAGIQYDGWVEDPVEISPTEVTFTIRDDAKWSDGHPITGTDLALRPIEWTLQKFLLPAPAYAPETDGGASSEIPNEPTWPLVAFDDFEIGKKSVTYRSSDGYFEKFTDKSIATHLGPFLIYFSPTHLAPFESFANAVFETVRRAQAGEIYPWYRPGKRIANDKTKVGSSVDTYEDSARISLVEEHLADVKFVRKYSKPENVLSTGVWDLVELDGKDFVFEVNTHHNNSDMINFDTIRFGFNRSINRQRADLKSNKLDLASPGTTPQPIIDAFPDNIKTLRVPSNGGNELNVNFHHPDLGKRAVRLAIMYALDQSVIAKNIHQSDALPVTTPGGDCWDATEYVRHGWINENLTTYSTNLKRAVSLMRDAGYTRKGGQWVNNDGKSLSLTLPTPNGTPKWEPTVASQLSEFGINTQVRTVDSNVFVNRRDAGEYTIWPGSGTSTGFANGTLGIWKEAAKKPDSEYGIYPDSQFETGEFSDSGTPLPRTNDRYSIFTIQAPPIGQPDGPLQEYQPATLDLGLASVSRKDYHDRVKTGMWLVNWFLPTIPINKLYIQHFIDNAHWLWPTNTASWKSFIKGGTRVPKGVLGNLALRADPDNPEKEAKRGGAGE